MLNGSIQNCAVTRGDDEYDLIYFVVKDGNNYYLEVLDYNSDVHLDSYKTYNPQATNPKEGYSNNAILWNKTKNITCNINDIPSGFISADNVVYIGYKFRSYIKSMPVIGNNPSKPVRIGYLVVRFLNSYRPVMKVAGLSDEKFTSIKSVPYSGIAKVTYPGKTEHDVCFELESDEMMDVNILSVDAVIV